MTPSTVRKRHFRPPLLSADVLQWCLTPFLLTAITTVDFTVDSPQVQGLRSILAIAHDYDVGTISLPIILKELQSEVESSNRVPARARARRTWLGPHYSRVHGQVEDCTRAAEVVVKSVKSFLNDKAAAEDASLKAVQFLCGSAFFAPYLNTLNNVCGRFAK